MHGLSAIRLAFLPLHELAPDLNLVSLDARGRGRSDKPPGPESYGHRRNADDAAEVLRFLGLSDVVVVGHSMGAWDGLQLAAHHPDLVAGVVLVDGGFFADLPEGVTPRQHVDAVLGAGWDDRLTATLPSLDLAMQLMQAHPALGPLWTDALEAHLREGFEELPDGTARGRCAQVAAVTDALDYFVPLERPYVRDDLRLVGCPVHLLRAEAGLSVSPETQAPVMSEQTCADFTRELPSLQIHTLPGTNHFSIAYGRAGLEHVVERVARLAAG